LLGERLLQVSSPRGRATSDDVGTNQAKSMNKQWEHKMKTNPFTHKSLFRSSGGKLLTDQYSGAFMSEHQPLRKKLTESQWFPEYTKYEL
jgi:hypothetical protein